MRKSSTGRSDLFHCLTLRETGAIKKDPKGVESAIGVEEICDALSLPQSPRGSIDLDQARAIA